MGSEILTVRPFWDSRFLGKLRFGSGMLWGWRRANIARSELEDHANLVVDLVALRQSLTLFERDPGAFVMSAYTSTELTFLADLGIFHNPPEPSHASPSGPLVLGFWF
jgi:hypothetical protein